MKTIIRIEHPLDGFGIFGDREKGKPFNHRFPDGAIGQFNYDSNDVGWFKDRHCDFNTPWADGIDFKSKEDYCAYKTVDQLQQWITREELMELIETYGFRVYALDVSIFQEGEHQICYKKQHILQQKDISSLFL